MIRQLNFWMCFPSFLYCVLLASACGDKPWEDDDDPEVSSVLYRQGIFLDGAVSGLDYLSETHSGITDANGKFVYSLREEVSFFIGGIELGSAAGAEILSPLNMVPGAHSIEHPSISNMIRFLQTLDKDADPSNGIEISASIRSAAENIAINFHQLVAEFEADQNVIDFIAANTSSGALVTAEAARTHFSEMMTANGIEPLSAEKHRFKVVRNLDPREQVPSNINGGLPFLSTDSNTYNLTETFILEDSFGFSHTVHLYYVKEPMDATDAVTSGLPNTWSLYVEVDDIAQQVGGADPDNPSPARFILRFGADGYLISGTSLVVSNWTPVYNNTTDSARPLGPDADNPLVTDPPSSSNFEIDISAVKFGVAVAAE